MTAVGSRVALAPDRWAMTNLFAWPRQLEGPHPVEVLLPYLEYLELLRAAMRRAPERLPAPLELLLGQEVARKAGLQPLFPNWSYLVHPSVLRNASDNESWVAAEVVFPDARHLPLLGELARHYSSGLPLEDRLRPPEAELLLVARERSAVVLFDPERHSRGFLQALALEKLQVCEMTADGGRGLTW